MKTKSKALGISFGFHTLMALLAMWALSISRPPVETVSIPLKTMTLISLNDFSHSPVTESVASAPVQQSTKYEPKPAKSLTQVQPVHSKPSPIIEKPTVQTPQNIVSAEIIPISQTVTPSPEIKPAVTATPAPVLAKELPKIDISAEKKSFFTSLRSKIQNNLHYPTAARRRGMEGEVDVRFVLEGSGIIRNVTVRNGSEIFHNAAKVAVASASGVKVPEVLANAFPSEIDLTLEFRLN